MRLLALVYAPPHHPTHPDPYTTWTSAQVETTVLSALVNFARALLTRDTTVALKRTAIMHVADFARGVLSLRIAWSKRGRKT